MTSFAYAQDMQNAISIIEKGSITVENLGRAPAKCKDCDVDENRDLSFYRNDPVNGIYESASYSGAIDPVYKQFFVQDGSGKRPTGFEILMRGPNNLAGAPLDPSQKIERQWKFVSKHGSVRETYIQITDDAGSGYLSQLMETVIILVPRRNRPAAEVVGDELHVILTTGEKVIYDNKTGLIKSGALIEGAIDTNPNRHQRKFVPLKYMGTGISIRTNKRGEDPRTATPTATVSQNGKTCEVPNKDLWGSNTDFKFSNDDDLIKYLNSKCPGKFKL